ncbi:MAG: fibronectin type III domain-containing protein [Dictyoglomus turgidum]|uniref:fibronectin type III domain-containing protein n=1 Tax=Dictyoglomus turgidum TaxID=513050 RepID=UPI003C759B53
MKNSLKIILLVLSVVLIALLISGCAPKEQPPAVTKPSAPTNLVAEALSATEVRLTWQDNSNNEDGFKIERKKEGEDWTQIATVEANVTTFTDTGLNSNTKYYYRVKAYNSAGDSDYSNEAEVTTLVNWSVYDWTNTVEPPTGWIDGNLNYPMANFCTLQDGILKMDTTSNAAATPSFRFNFDSASCQPGSFKMTIVFKAKGEVGITNVTRAWTLDIQTTLYRGGFEIQPTQVRILNGTGTLVSTTGVTGADWHVYWFTIEYNLDGLYARLYVDGNPTPILEGNINAAPSTIPDPQFMRLGDTSTSTSNLYIGYIDWILWTFDGAFVPGQVQIPEGFSLNP